MQIKELQIVPDSDPDNIMSADTADGSYWIRNHPSIPDVFIVSRNFDAEDDRLYPHTIVSDHMTLKLAESAIQLIHKHAVEDFIHKWIQENHDA